MYEYLITWYLGRGVCPLDRTTPVTRARVGGAKSTLTVSSTVG